MIPKLALNFSVDKKSLDKETATDYVTLFDRMRANKIIYVEIVLSGCTTLDEVKKFITLFKTMRNSKHIDYTIWLEVGSDPFKAHDLYVQANKVDRLVMGVASLTEITDIPNLLITMHHMTYPDIHDIMMLPDDKALEYSLKAINDINAPEGMKRGLSRVIEDYAKIHSRVLSAPDSSELLPSSDQDQE